jgi:hypothetical protein
MVLLQNQARLLPNSAPLIEMSTGYAKMGYAHQKGLDSICPTIARKRVERVPKPANGTATKDLDFFICFDALAKRSPCPTKEHR